MNPSLESSRKFLVLICFLALCFFGVPISVPLLAPLDPLDLSMYESLKAPSSEHVFGTERLGRDLFSRILYGARISLKVPLTLVESVCLIGTLLGSTAGFLGYKTDSLIMRLSDITISFPSMNLSGHDSSHRSGWYA